MSKTQTEGDAEIERTIAAYIYSRERLAEWENSNRAYQQQYAKLTKDEKWQVRAWLKSASDAEKDAYLL